MQNHRGSTNCDHGSNLLRAQNAKPAKAKQQKDCFDPCGENCELRFRLSRYAIAGALTKEVIAKRRRSQVKPSASRANAISIIDVGSGTAVGSLS